MSLTFVFVSLENEMFVCSIGEYVITEQMFLINISIVGSSGAVAPTSFIQERDALHQRVSRIHWKYHHYNSIFVC